MKNNNKARLMFIVNARKQVEKRMGKISSDLSAESKTLGILADKIKRIVYELHNPEILPVFIASLIGGKIKVWDYGGKRNKRLEKRIYKQPEYIYSLDAICVSYNKDLYIGNFRHNYLKAPLQGYILTEKEKLFLQEYFNL